MRELAAFGPGCLGCAGAEDKEACAPHSPFNGRKTKPRRDTHPGSGTDVLAGGWGLPSERPTQTSRSGSQKTRLQQSILEPKGKQLFPSALLQ